jgi:DNA-binding FadR family transcriptional regulator
MASYPGRGIHREAVEELAERILSGAIAEGETIEIARLVADLGVSLTVVREALRVLAAKGLVDARPKRGTFVRPRADWNLLDADVIRWQFAGRGDETFVRNMAELRGIVEPAVARLAATRRTEADLEAIGGALRQMGAKEATPAEAVQADLAFHRALLAATHNELIDRLDVLLETGLAERDRMVHTSPHAGDPLPSHRAVYDAIAAREPEAAEGAMHRLLDQADRDLNQVRQPAAGGEAA